jgi:predicted MFS family arabinose efflux permease
MYTVFAVMPSLADTLGLSSARAGLVCSIWLFARLVAFIGLWQWEGWHYRFGGLAAAYVAMTMSFAAMLLVASLPVVIGAQIVFGLACGLIYYSSLYYSMDVGDADAKHGGIHEAAIGAGIFTGPAVAAVSLSAFPAAGSGSVYAVTGLLTIGLLTIIGKWRESCRRQ